MSRILFIFIVIGLLIRVAVIAHQSLGQSIDQSLLQPGEEIDGMTLTTGASDAPPLWAFCYYQEGNHGVEAHCRVSQMPKLAIGHAFLAPGNILSQAEWSEITWELSLDGRAIDLNEFGTYNYALPRIEPGSSPFREVFMKYTAWDIVLRDLQPGIHTLQGHAHTDTEEYSWVVVLTVEEFNRSGFNPVP